MRSCKHSRLGARAAVLAIAAVLVGCEGTVSVDLGTLAPADPRIASVIVELDGVEFQKSGGGTQTLQFDEPQQVDLIDYLDSNDFRLLTDETLDDGNYSGVRLLFGPDEEKENRVVLTNNREFALTLESVAAASDVDFTVDKDESSKDNVQLTLDLRQSLTFDDDNDNGTVLKPVIRAIRTEDAGGAAGNVAVTCPQNSALAVYLFTGEVTPDDIDGATPDPYLTTSIPLNGSSVSTSGYSFPFLPEGRYTLASTCRADEETPAVSEDLNFEHVVNIDVEAEKSVTQNIPR